MPSATQNNPAKNVLQLSGDGDSVRLPSDAFNHLTEATVEAWVKWQRLSRNAQPFGFGKTWQVMGVHNGLRTRDLVFFIYLQAQQLYVITVPNVLHIDQWYHIAAVSGHQGMQVYLNGVLAGEHDFTGSFAAIGNGEQNSLGQAHWQENAFFFGQLADVRIWSRARSAEQIRRTMHQPPTGEDEKSLVAWWDFSKGDARDASGNGLHGELLGHAHCVPGAPPTATETRRLSILHGQVVNELNHPVPQATLRLEQTDAAPRTTQTDATGHYQLAVWEPRETSFDLAASHSELGAWKENIPLDPGDSAQVDLVLQEAINIEGTLRAIDNTPHANIVVQALWTAGAEPPRLAATTSSDEGGQYRFVNLRPGRYQIRCHVDGDYAYYCATAASEKSTFLEVEAGRPQSAIDFSFAPFKKGVWRSYTSTEGLASNSLWSLYRADDGIMWFGTTGGISFFDGAVIKTLATPEHLQNFRIRTIHQDRAGGLWFGTELEGVWHFDGRSFKHFSTENGLAGDEVRAIYSAPDGEMFFGTVGGLSRYDGKTFTHLTSKDGLVDNWICTIHAEGDGVLWIGTFAGLSRYDGSTFTRFTTADGLPDNRVKAITHDAEGTLWVGTEGGICRLDGDRFISFTSADGLVHDVVNAIHCDLSGRLWIGTMHGLSRFDGRAFVNFKTTDGLVNDFVISIAHDADGVLWFGTEGGVSRFDDSLRHFTSKDGLAHQVQDLYQDAEGTLWIGSVGGIYRYCGGQFTHFTTQDGLAHNKIYVVDSTPAGLLCTTDLGVCRYDGTRFITDEEMRGSYVFSFLCDDGETLWFGTSAGVFKYQDGRCVANITTQDGLASDNVQAIGQDAEGVVFFGTQSGLSRFDGKTLQTFTTEDGLPHNWVWAIAQDAQGHLWVGTEGGLARFDGKTFISYSTADGLAHDDIRTIFCASDGILWVGGDGGIVSCFDGTIWSSLDSRDGLQGSLIRAIAQDAQGAMWFGSDRGATRYQRSTTTAPVAHIVEVQADTRTRDLSALKALTVGVRTTIEYTSTDFKTRPEKRQYRHRVMPTASATTTESIPWSRATRATRFEWIPREEGNYLFEVQAIDRDLNYSQPARLDLHVAPEPQLEALRRTRGELEDAYRALAGQNEALETQRQELQVAKETAEEAQETAETANRAKSIFLANMSHEIRTPMNAMLGFTQILLRDSELRSDQRRAAETIEQSGQHLLSLIDEVLDISRIEAGRQELQESDFDLVALIRELSAMFELRCTQKGLSWHLEGTVAEEADLAVRGDEGKLRQVLSNLLSNAVKFTPSGEVVLRLSRITADEAICFEVEDSGPGLDPEEQQRIFEPFQQGQTASTQEGAGLGLAIAQRLVEMLGGQLEVDSTPDQGARFFFTLPFQPSASPVAPQIAGSQIIGLQPGYTVQALVVDDLEENRQVLSGLLQSIGCQVALAASGEEAVESFAAQRADIVFMDIRMPGIDGVEAARRIWKAHGPIPIAAVSASALIHEQRSYLQAGFAAFLAKPLRFAQICQCLANHLQVEFEYQEEHNIPPAWAGVVLPDALWRSLNEAVEMGEVTRLRAALDQIEPLGEKERLLAQHLAELSRALDLAAIGKILGALQRAQ